MLWNKANSLKYKYGHPRHCSDYDVTLVYNENLRHRLKSLLLSVVSFTQSLTLFHFVSVSMLMLCAYFISQQSSDKSTKKPSSSSVLEKYLRKLCSDHWIIFCPSYLIDEKMIGRQFPDKIIYIVLIDTKWIKLKPFVCVSLAKLLLMLMNAISFWSF